MSAVPIIQAYTVPKRGHNASENEDAVAFDAREGWVAIADGATEASYSREWAEILARSGPEAAPTTVKDRVLDLLLPMRRLHTVVEDLQQRWYDTVPWARLEVLGWLFVEKAQQGALATFLTLKLEGQKWNAIGVGDCNLFVVEESGDIRVSYPARSFEEFGTSPSLMPSIPGPAVKTALASVWRKTGKWRNDEKIIMCTDAVAAYLLEKGQRGRTVWKTLFGMGSCEDFADWVEQARNNGMRNDDSTVVIVSQPNGTF